MRVIIEPLSLPGGVEEQGLEIVELKGLGHPDTICDHVADAFATALAREYDDRFGHVLHYNVDKALLRAGRSRPAYGGGEVLEPIELWLAGRATDHFRGVSVPVAEIAEAAARQWFREHMHLFDDRRHLRVRCVTRPGATELTDLFDRRQQDAPPLANDTSCGVGFWPLSPLERSILATERALNAPETKLAHPAWGEDVKIMGLRAGCVVQLTVACALGDAHVPGASAYSEECAAIVAFASRAAAEILGDLPSLVLNAADDLARGDIFLTVTGTSAEAGDDGQVGRGNRGNGIITPLRPMTLEATSGKNSVSHVGRLYNLVAPRIAREIVEKRPEVDAARCFLVSAIGQPIDAPQLLALQLSPADAACNPELREHAQAIAREALTRLWCPPPLDLAPCRGSAIAR